MIRRLILHAGFLGLSVFIALLFLAQPADTATVVAILALWVVLLLVGDPA